MEVSYANLGFGSFILRQIFSILIGMIAMIYCYNYFMLLFGRAGIDVQKMLKGMTDFPDNMPQDPLFLVAIAIPALTSVWAFISRVRHQGRKIAITPERILLTFTDGQQREIAPRDVGEVQIRENIMDKRTQYSVVISLPDKKPVYLVSVMAPSKFPTTIGGVPQPLRDFAEFIGKISGKPVRDVDRVGKDADFRTRPSL